MVNLFFREVPRVLNLFPRELIEGNPKDFSKANPRPYKRPDPEQKTRGVAGPEGFLAESLAKDAAEGLPEKNPEWGLHSTP